MGREIKGQFACEEHEEYGVLGLRPTAMPNADPMGGAAVAHDLLEHFQGDDGGVEAEFQALGASCLIRGETGYSISTSKMGYEHHIAADFLELYRHVAQEGFTLLDPGTVKPCEDESTDETLAAAVRLGLKELREETTFQGEDPEEDEDLMAFCCEQNRERILGWLRIGYRKAQERYEGVDIYTLAHEVFSKIESRVDKWLKGSAEAGMIVDVVIDLDRLSVSIEAGYGVDETDYCGDCEGSGEVDGTDYHDCPRALDGCDPTDPSPDCSECKGDGYITPPVKCDTCGGSGEVDATYREEI